MIQVQETIKKYGYDPRELSEWSRKKVLVKCEVCWKVYSKTLESVNVKTVCIDCSRKENGNFQIDRLRKMDRERRLKEKYHDYKKNQFYRQSKYNLERQRLKAEKEKQLNMSVSTQEETDNDSRHRSTATTASGTTDTTCSGTT